MSDATGGWEAFDPSSDSIASHPVLSERGIFALVSSDTGHDEGWGPDIALALAVKAASSGRATVLYDLAIDQPRLNRVAVAPAGGLGSEGVTDMVRYGASHARVANELAPSLHLVPAGTVDPDPGAVLEAETLLERVRATCASIESSALLYLPAGAPGADTLVARTDGTVWIGREDQAPPAWLGAESSSVLAHWGPPSGTSQGADTIGGAEEALDGEGPEIGPEWPEFGEPLVVADPGEIDPEVAGERVRPGEPAPFDFGVEVAGEPIPTVEVAGGPASPAVEPRDPDPWAGTDGAREPPATPGAHDPPATQAYEAATGTESPAAATPVAPPAAAATGWAPLASPGAGVARTVRRDRRRTRPFLLVLFVLFLLTIAVLVWAGYLEIPALDWLLGDPS